MRHKEIWELWHPPLRGNGESLSLDDGKIEPPSRPTAPFGIGPTSISARAPVLNGVIVASGNTAVCSQGNEAGEGAGSAPKLGSPFKPQFVAVIHVAASTPPGGHNTTWFKPSHDAIEERPCFGLVDRTMARLLGPNHDSHLETRLQAGMLCRNLTDGHPLQVFPLALESTKDKCGQGRHRIIRWHPHPYLRGDVQRQD